MEGPTASKRRRRRIKLIFSFFSLTLRNTEQHFSSFIIIIMAAATATDTAGNTVNITGDVHVTLYMMRDAANGFDPFSATASPLLPSTSSFVVQQQQQPPATNNKVYLAGDWHHPPVALAARLEAAGYELVSKWWDTREAHSGKTKLQQEEVAECSWFILDMRSPRYGTHPFAGSIKGLGHAEILNKHISVIVPEMQSPETPDARRLYTSLIKQYATTNEDDLFPTGIWGVRQDGGGGGGGGNAAAASPAAGAVGVSN